MPLTTAAQAAPSLDVDPYDPDTLRDPHAAHDRVRRAGPLVRLERSGVWATGRHAVAKAILRDWETFISSGGVGIDDMRVRNEWVEPGLLLRVDPPDHTRAKRIIQRILSPANVGQLRETLAAEARALVSGLLARDSFDAVTDVAQPYVLKVFPDAVGLAAEGRGNLLPWGDMSFNAMGPQNAIFRRSTERVSQVQSWIHASCQREALAPGGFGRLIYEGVDNGEIDSREAWLLVRGLLTAGLDTTVHTIGVALHFLAKAPSEFARLRADPALARAAFEEALRLNGTVQNFYRTTARETVLEGVAIPKDAKVLLLFGAANRDPEAWEAPDRFDITRRSQGHLGFGHGIHQCVGQMIARLEGEALLTALAEGVTRLEPAGPVEWHLNNSVRGLARAPMRVA